MMTYSEVDEARSHSGLFSYDWLKQLADTGLNLIFPPRCVHCGRVDADFCKVCLKELDDAPIRSLRLNLPPLQAVIATQPHSGVYQSAVQALKYHNVHWMGKTLGQHLALALQNLDWTFDIIVPVPLHISRLEERGYNQSQEIARVIATQFNRLCVPEAIVRQRSTRSQVGLNQAERHANLTNAFVAQPEQVAGKSLLVVDDVRTTGTTLVNCAEAALEAGAKAIYGITVTASAGS